MSFRAMDSPFENRLRKNFKHLRKWAKAQDLTAFRVYDRDMPEYPFVIEWFDGRAHVVEFPRRRSKDDENAQAQRDEVCRAVQAILEVPPDRIFTKTHLRMPWGKSQYERIADENDHFVVREQGLEFWVNLRDFLDTGLFMDHRKTRKWVREASKGKDFLNLFAYTGSFTVYAAAGGAKTTTTVDLSNTYLEWAQENLVLNGLWRPEHLLIRADVLQWLKDAANKKERFDVIVCDPPSFSTSKKMTGTLNVQRDHVRIIEACKALLRPRGTLFFSTNYTGFQLEETKFKDFPHEELTPRSLPEDFHVKTIHRCWRFQATPQVPQLPSSSTART
jgi:23S rRNA (cytosine1962-C5)-methyltransferase